MYTCPSVKCCARPGVSVYPEAKLPGRGKEKEREEGSDEDGGGRFASRPQDRDKVFDKYPRGCIGRESRWHFLNYSVTIKFLRAAAATGRQRRRSSLSTLRTAGGMKADRASVNVNARANERRVLGSVTKI